MFRWLRRTAWPEFVVDYVEGTSRRVDRKLPWPELEFIVLDAETTGFDYDTDRLLSIGLVPVRRGRILVEERRAWLVQQLDAPNNEAVKIHGIAPDASAHGQPEEKVLRELLDLLRGRILVGHHIGFDSSMISAALQRHFGTRLRNPMLDTAMIARRRLDAFHKTGYANQRPPGLDELCTHAGLPVIGRHTASGDAFTTAQLFLWLCGRMRVRLGRELVAGDLFRG
ncbi:3'-5' exonuclease [Actomonas aquatica]|uniref:3'-5' exonuclease n=1 Tax=Actomonas aquatica TaxID=2866162 RepID=A0ABZ1CDV0_9BACT|nr:3'-5' exonuclease [Opitutus sp. WL0086]WRQ89540.1 3'-5' exonuclease [Opitutus sp. WL0086]